MFQIFHTWFGGWDSKNQKIVGVSIPPWRYRVVKHTVFLGENGNLLHLFLLHKVSAIVWNALLTLSLMVLGIAILIWSSLSLLGVDVLVVAAILIIFDVALTPRYKLKSYNEEVTRIARERFENYYSTN